MRKLLTIAAILFTAFAGGLRADIAAPGPIQVKQPDGSTITIHLHGDEYYSWATDDSGAVIRQQSDGWWKRSGISQSAMLSRDAARIREDNMRIAPRGRGGLGLGMGSKHFLVLLVEFSDLHFQSGAKEYFTRALNESGFSDNGSVGSARDYWIDNSAGQFQPTFDVIGPVTLSRAHNDFPTGDSDHHYGLAKTMIQEAVAQMDATVNFKEYDHDGDGYIDNIYMFFPGYAQSNGGGKDTIWPHASGTYVDTNDGVKTGSYACSAELLGSSGTTRNGIGTFCHEFGHVIGLPDLYDTNYETDGQAQHPAVWNLMASGNHNSNGRIPPYLSTYEKYILGYITDLKDISSTGSKTLKGVQHHESYILPTTTDGEIFILEVRTAQKWDSGVIQEPSGLLIYHTDRSARDVNGQSAARRWEYWDEINGYGAHPCHYLKVPVENLQVNSSTIYDYSQMRVFPNFYGWYNVTDYNPEDWNGTVPFRLTGISYNSASQTASLYISSGDRVVTGCVTDADSGRPVSGAAVYISATASRTSAYGRVLSRSAMRSTALYEARTGSDGRYTISVGSSAPDALTVSVFADNYLPSEQNITVTSAMSHDVRLTPVLHGTSTNEILKYNTPVYYIGHWGYDSSKDYSAAVKFSIQDLAEHKGKQISAIKFYYINPAREVSVFVDKGTTERLFVQKVDTPVPSTWDSDNNISMKLNTVDVSGQGVVISGNEDLYIGYMLRSSQGQYSMFSDGGKTEREGDKMYDGSFYYVFDYSDVPPLSWNDAHTTWNTTCNLLISAELTTLPYIDSNTGITDLGISYITPPAGQPKAGDSFPLDLTISRSNVPSSVIWLYDGELRDAGSSVTLTSGTHTVRAVLQYSDSGKVDYVELILNVN